MFTCLIINQGSFLLCYHPDILANYPIQTLTPLGLTRAQATLAQLPREAMDVPCLEVLKARLDGAACSGGWQPCLWLRIGT